MAVAVEGCGGGGLWRQKAVAATERAAATLGCPGALPRTWDDKFADAQPISYDLLAIYYFFVGGRQDCQRYRVCDAGASRAFH